MQEADLHVRYDDPKAELTIKELPKVQRCEKLLSLDLFLGLDELPAPMTAEEQSKITARLLATR